LMKSRKSSSDAVSFFSVVLTCRCYYERLATEYEMQRRAPLTNTDRTLIFFLWGVDYKVHAQCTTMEGDMGAIMYALKSCHEVLLAMGCPRISSK
jgi:hypothetical protein